MAQVFVGIHPFGHDSSIAIVDCSNKKIFAYNLERFTRFKHDYRFCGSLIRDALETFSFGEIAVASNEVSAEIIAHFDTLYNYELILKKLKLLRKNRSITLLNPVLLFKFVFLRKRVNSFSFSEDRSAFTRYINKHYSINKVKYYDHHTSHALAAYYLCNWKPEVGDGILTLDGQGDGYCSKLFRISEGIVELSSVTNDFSFNMLYTRATGVLGFSPNADEGKLEALACYSVDPRSTDLYKDLIKIFQISDSGKLFMDWSVIGKAIYSVPKELRSIEALLRIYLTSMSKEDFAGAVQSAYEDIFLSYIRHIQMKFNFKRMLFSGGGFANVKLNMRIFESGLFDRVYVCPAMGDDGIAIGCALSNAAENGQDVNWVRDITIPYFGQEYSKDEVLETLNRNLDIIDFKLYNGDDYFKEVAKSIFEGKIVALFQGRMEYGPRALGNRSILASPLVASIRDDINLKFKRREYFQPFCPTFLEKDREYYFANSYCNKHMTSAFQIRDEFRGVLPSVIHVDGTCRAQFLEENDNPNYYSILMHFKNLSGHGVLLDTSFNIHGKTIVRTPQDAIDDFMSCGLDFLFIEGIKVSRKS